MEIAQDVTPRGKLDEEAEKLMDRIAYLEEKMEQFQDQGLNSFQVAMELGQTRRCLSFIQRVRGD